jgi:hypothetical protein
MRLFFCSVLPPQAAGEMQFDASRGFIGLDTKAASQPVVRVGLGFDEDR